MKNDIMKGMTLFCTFLCAASMGCILYLSAKKVITISEAGHEEIRNGRQDVNQIQEYVKGETASQEQVLTFVIGKSDTSYLRIPLPEKCSAEDIVVENHYMDKELCIIINGAKEEFYEENAISGNRSMVRQGLYEETQGNVRLIFQLTGICECRTILEDHYLYISFLSPREAYNKIVVIDPACGGLNVGVSAQGLLEKDVSLGIAKKLKEKLDQSDIKAYYTRIDDVNPDEKDRTALANETRADMYIRIQVDSHEDSSVYGTTAVYNGNYFIPGFGSVELADLLERSVVTNIKGKALGLSEAQAQEYVLRNVTVPAAAVKAGCITNKQEATLLGREDYQDKIAEGIYQAILSAYENYF